jgi:hypothetical protein
MEQLVMQGTEDTPKIVFDKNSNTFEISGRSLPEDVVSFYQPVIDWLDKYQEAPLPETTINIKLEYFNTASSKLLLDILMVLEEINQNGSSVKVNWYFEEDDEDMQEAGEEYADLVNLTVELISY